MHVPERFVRVVVQKPKKFPPYGAALAKRLKYDNVPLLVFVFAGAGAWDRAKDPRATSGDCAALVWDSGEVYRWPVKGCYVVVEINTGPSRQQCAALAGELLNSGARSVLLWWLNDESMPIAFDHLGRQRLLPENEIYHHVVRRQE